MKRTKTPENTPDTHALPGRKKPKKRYFQRRFFRLLIQLLAWIGVAILYYVVFSLFFDTPIEYEVSKTNRQLEEQYEMLSQRYDSLQTVLTDVVERDRNVYSMLFESAPYEDETPNGAWTDYSERLFSMTNNELAVLYFETLSSLGEKVRKQTEQFDELQKKMQEKGSELDYIPAIQPVNNRELTKLAASYGMRIQPFYKTMSAHQGVDFAIPENSRVYATADGTVSQVSTAEQGQGVNITIDHGNGYRTYYAHLNKATVRKGARVRRGDIIAQSGNTGLSFMPHLHYEVLYQGRRVDPINYFFLELDPRQQAKLQKIALIGMQSLD